MFRAVCPALLLAVGCGPFEPMQGPALQELGERALVADSPEANGVLAFLNDRGTSVDVLDHDVALDARAAHNLITHRDGPDGIYGTSDDDLFDDIHEVDAVRWVGKATIARLADYAQAAGWIVTEGLGGTYDGVHFTDQEAEATLALANEAESDWLDDTLGLDRRAVAGIVDARPLSGLDALAAVPWVGESALRRLRAAALVEPAETPLEERFVVDLEPTLTYWYGQYGDDVTAMGGNTLAQAIDALDPQLVYEITDPEDDPYGHDLDRFIVLAHPDVAFPGSDRVWLGIYDRVSGSLTGTNWY